MTGESDAQGRLAALRGTLTPARSNARSVAALTENPGCTRRRVIDAAGVRSYELAERLGHPVTRGQSPFAIASGNMFERRLKQFTKYGLLAEAVAPFVDLPEGNLRVIDASKVSGVAPFTDAWFSKRAAITDKALAAIAGGDPESPHLVDHPVLRFEVAGAVANLEPDALALKAKTGLQLVEIKSFPVIDEQADPEKLAAMAGQSAVYLLALRAALERLGFDPDILDWSVVLVAPKNFGRTPTAHRVPLTKKARALQRVIGAVPEVGELLEYLPADLTFDIDPDERSSEDERRQRLDYVVRQLPMLYVPDCLASCDMARYCRQRAIDDDDPSRLGRDARDSLAGVHSLATALRIARGSATPDDEAPADVVNALQAAHHAISRARSRVSTITQSGT